MTVVGTHTARYIRRGPVSVRDLVVYQQRQTVFESLVAVSGLPINLSGDGRQPERVAGAALTAGALQAVRVKPVLGHLSRESDHEPGALETIAHYLALLEDAFCAVAVSMSDDAGFRQPAGRRSTGNASTTLSSPTPWAPSGGPAPPVDGTTTASSTPSRASSPSNPGACGRADHGLPGPNPCEAGRSGPSPESA